jgi:uncharacterized protein YdcH (DUF465 family)
MSIHILNTRLTSLESQFKNISINSDGKDEQNIDSKIENFEKSFDDKLQVFSENIEDKFSKLENNNNAFIQKLNESMNLLVKKIELLEKNIEKNKASQVESMKQLQSKVNSLQSTD